MFIITQYLHLNKHHVFFIQLNSFNMAIASKNTNSKFSSRFRGKNLRMYVQELVNKGIHNYHSDIKTPSKAIFHLNEFKDTQKVYFKTLSWKDARMPKENFKFERPPGRKKTHTHITAYLLYEIPATKKIDNRYTLSISVPLESLSMCGYSKYFGITGITIAAEDTMGRLRDVFGKENIDWGNHPLQ